ncbi:MAG: Flp pilus assembly protein CpaB [Methylophilales bacterium]|jgi:pilus assembly protein CpaB|nr:Flp pilus assembly protein CpaB [Methylophilales bacterium]
MKNPRAVVMIVISLLVGLGAVLAASHWVSQQTTVASNKVVVANKDIDLGTPLTPQMLSLTDWPKGSMPTGAFSQIKNLETRVIKTSILRGEPILESKLAPIGSTGGLSAVISKGNRAITVRVNDVIGVAGFALPGNYVDIVVNTEDDTAKESIRNKSISKIVLEHILVLAIAQEQGRDDTKPKVVNAVTLEVSPSQAEKLDLARSVGTLSLVLRNQIDKMPVSTLGSTKKNLLNQSESINLILAESPTNEVKKVVVNRSNPIKKYEPREKIEVVRGNTSTSEEFKNQ